MTSPLAAPDSPNASDATDRDTVRYRALCARDPRFDGRFFTGVTSTGIYCRPVCSVRTPLRRHCRFFDDAAQAEQAGFRPCLRCRPELAPRERRWTTHDAGDLLLRHATDWLDDPQRWPTGDRPAGVAALARHLGVSDRHLRRVFDERLGVTPLRYWQTRRLLAAKQLLTDTDLPVAEVARSAGFGSVRRFNDAFLGQYGLHPTGLRRRGAGAGAGDTTLLLAWRPPLNAPALWRFFAERALPGVEQVDPVAGELRRVVRLQAGGRSHIGWVHARLDAERHRLILSASDGLHGALPALAWQARAWFDLDADPAAIHASLGTEFPQAEGLRVPGGPCGFELAARAVLGQQISVAAARTIAQRLVALAGEPVSTPWPGLTHAFPDAAAVARLQGDALGGMGIVRQRQAALLALARAVDDGALDLSPHADPERTLATLTALPGVGSWTAHYIALRALRWPDAWPPGDVALHRALSLDGSPLGRERQAAAMAERWRPWRGYATLALWAGLWRSPT